MKTTPKYKINLLLLDKKPFTSTKEIRARDILELDSGVKIAFGYEGLKHKPSMYIAIYNGIAVIIHNRINDGYSIEDDLIKWFGSLSATSQAIIERYEELKIVSQLNILNKEIAKL